ncbi:MAG TPA: acyl-CoA dehydrogenase family protein [Terriglobales bacterium]|nr:acyl-CoA dehydrogenase family protein [Terriglobales bacterium]
MMPSKRPVPVKVLPDLDLLRSPSSFLKQHLAPLAPLADLERYETWFLSHGQAISDAVDRARTPWLRMFDVSGGRVDEVCFPSEYWAMLYHGYRAGVIWRAFEQQSLLPSYQLIYLTSFFDPGLSCPYTVSLSTALPLEKYADRKLKQRFLDPMLSRDDSVWQGATWMTEIKGGSDLGANIETVARRDGDRWLLTGDKYFASNAGAEVAVVAARPEGAPRNVRGLGLFVLPRRRDDGMLNYTIRRLKDKIATRSVPTGEVELRDSHAWLLGPADAGIYLILEVLNVSRVANSVGSVGLAQRALADAVAFAEQRVAFGKPILEHPLVHHQIEERVRTLVEALALAWEAVVLLNEVWQESSPYSDRYHLFRLIAHLAKYWTAEFAVQTSKWCMEIYGGLGTLEENRVERWLRESMILAIWEGTAHRQVLDGLEVIERKHAHELLLKHLAPYASDENGAEVQARIEAHLALPAEKREACAEPLFRDLAAFSAQALARRRASASRRPASG